MEQEKSLEQEVNAIYHAIQEREAFIKEINSDMDKGENPKRQQQSRILFYASIIAIVFSYSLLWLSPPSTTMVIVISIGILLGYFIMLIATIIDFLILKQELPQLKKGLLNLFFEGLYRTLNHDVAFSQTLQQFSTRALVIVKNRLSTQYTLVQHRLSSMVGSLSKLGLLPGILAISVTLFNQEYHQVTIHIAVILFVFYAIAHKANNDLPRLLFYAQMLEDEVSIRGSSS